MSNCALDPRRATLLLPNEKRRRELRGMKWRIGIATSVLAAAGALFATAPAGMAKDGDVLAAGSCTRTSTSKIKLSDEDGRIEVEFEVDQNRNGVRWSVALTQNGRRLARLTRVTRGPSGSFEARVVAANTGGADSFRARAVSRSGETCAARASF
jgi:hypothetical protein